MTPKYECNYVICICPKCHKKVVLKIYSKHPIIMSEIAEIHGEETNDERSE